MGKENKQYEYWIDVPVWELHTYSYKVVASSDEEAMKKYMDGDTEDWENSECQGDQDAGEPVISSKEEI